MTPKYQYTCTVSYWKQQSSTRDAGVRDTDLQLPSACDPACRCTNTLEQRATKALVAVTFTTKRLLVIMFSEYTMQTMGSNTSSWLLLTLCAIALRPGSYVAFLPCRMQFKQKIMRQIISLSIVSIAFDTAEMRRINRALELSLNHEQQEPKLGTTPVLQMCKICHSMTGGSLLLPSKTILNYPLSPKYSLKTSKKCAWNIFPSSL